MVDIFFEEPNIPELREEFTLVDMHYHTQYSADCQTKLPEVLKLAEKLDLGIAITDHNEIAGNLKAQRQKKVMVIPATEVTTKNDKDILMYFYTKNDMIEFYEKVIKNTVRKHTKFRFNKLKLSAENILEAAKELNAVISVPHPFAPLPKKSFYYFNRKKNSYLLDFVDAIEVINGAMKRKGNLASFGWASSENKGFTAGSDGHRLNWLGASLTGCKADSVEEFLECIRKKQNIVIGKEVKLGYKVIADLSILRNKI